MRMRITAILALAGATVLGACDSAAPAQGTETTSSPTDELQSEPSGAVADFALTCDYPVAAGDSAATLLARYGDAARRDEIGGAEGEVLEGVVLWPGDPARRLEVLFADPAMEHPALVRTYEPASRWKIAGLGPGSTLADIVARNGKPITFYGFEWDYGGYVTGFGGGMLERLPGSCDLGMRLGTKGDDSLPSGVSGERELRSDAPALAGLPLTIDEISLGYPPLEGTGR